MNPLSLVLRPSMLAAVFAVSIGLSVRAGALEEYVGKPDASFAWQVRTQEVAGAVDHVVIDLTSQTWHDIRWRHELHILYPRTVKNPSLAFLEVSAGVGRGVQTTAQRLAEQCGVLVAIVTSVPNQPLFDNRSEDSLIAYTFDKYLKTGDDTWPLLLPMTKSAVRAMDAVQAWATKQHRQTVTRFVVSGASKRGWTTWLTGAVDPRVCAIAPVVIDMLNMKAQTQWAQRVYGRQSEKISDYTDLGLVEQMDRPEMARLRDIVDPYSYRARFTMPKLLLLGTNDPYWTVDALRHYWGDLPGPKEVYQAPNAGHGAGGTPEAIQTLAAFLQHVSDGQTPPQLTWNTSGNGKASVSVTADRAAKQALLWTATSPTRDFRSAKWQSSPLPLDAAATHASAEVAAPTNGFTAVLVELAFAAPRGGDYRLSTQVQVTPDEKP